MICPKKVFVGGVAVAVERKDLTGEDWWGHYDHDEKVIALDLSLKGEKLRETLRHEILEASLMIGGPAWCDGMETEAIVRCHEEIFVPAWRNVSTKI